MRSPKPTEFPSVIQPKASPPPQLAPQVAAAQDLQLATLPHIVNDSPVALLGPVSGLRVRALCATKSALSLSEQHGADPADFLHTSACLFTPFPLMPVSEMLHPKPMPMPTVALSARPLCARVTCGVLCAIAARASHGARTTSGADPPATSSVTRLTTHPSITGLALSPALTGQRPRTAQARKHRTQRRVDAPTLGDDAQ